MLITFRPGPGSRSGVLPLVGPGGGERSWFIGLAHPVDSLDDYADRKGDDGEFEQYLDKVSDVDADSRDGFTGGGPPWLPLIVSLISEKLTPPISSPMGGMMISDYQSS